MDETKTYTKRENAKRAAIAAGVPTELVEITVHKTRDEVRFGWAQKEAPNQHGAPQDEGAADVPSPAAPRCPKCDSAMEVTEISAAQSTDGRARRVARCPCDGAVYTRDEPEVTTPPDGPRSADEAAAGTVGAAASRSGPVAAPADPQREERAAVQPAREEHNGVKRPRPGGLCAQVWDYLDANPTATAKELREVAPSKGWNLNNVSAEFYAWRKFLGISSRAKPAV